MAWSETQLGPVIGSEVTGIDLNNLDGALVAQLRERLAERMVLVIRDQKLDRDAHKAVARLFGTGVLHRHALGRITPDSDAPLHDGVRFRIASLTKPVVTVAALMLVNEGRLDLDAPVGSILPPLRDLRLADGTPAQPTVRDLMRHSAGFAYPQEIPQAALRATWTAAAPAPGRSVTRRPTAALMTSSGVF